MAMSDPAPSTTPPVNRPHQRKGARSNAHVGTEFEGRAQAYLARLGVVTKRGFKVTIGIREPRKEHGFDLGSDELNLVVECKSHRWTEGNKVPSAKLAVWNEAMYYLSLVPPSMKRILFVLRDVRGGDGEPLADYYVRTYGHLIPLGVEIWEYDEDADRHRVCNSPNS